MTELQDGKKYRDFCFTYNNYTELDSKRLFGYIKNDDGQDFECEAQLFQNPKENILYLVCGKEIGEEKRTPHLQGFIQFKNPRYFSAVKKLIGNGAHFNKRKGTPEEASKYCKKGEQPHAEWKEFQWNGPNYGKNAIFKEYGTLKEDERGKRTDLIKIKDEILNGKPVLDILLESPQLYHQYGRTFNAIEDFNLSKTFRKEMTKGIWYWGNTGVGKSELAFKDYSPSTHYKVPTDKGWWDNYRQQPTVILNDFRGEIPYNELLNLVDWTPHEVSRRSRPPMPFTSKLVIITSSIPPVQVYKRRNAQDSIEQLYRRFEIYRVDSIDNKPVATLDKGDSLLFEPDGIETANAENPPQGGSAFGVLYGTGSRNRSARGNTIPEHIKKTAPQRKTATIPVMTGIPTTKPKIDDETLFVHNFINNLKLLEETNLKLLEEMNKH